MITVNIEKAKEQTAHPLRREKRDAQYLVVDGGTPYASLTPEGQEKRDAIKLVDDTLQLEIDAAKTEDELKSVLAKI